MGQDRVASGELHDKEAQGGHIGASATRECPEMSARFSHMLGSDISSHKSRKLDPPYVSSCSICMSPFFLNGPAAECCSECVISFLFAG